MTNVDKMSFLTVEMGCSCRSRASGLCLLLMLLLLNGPIVGCSEGDSDTRALAKQSLSCEEVDKGNSLGAVITSTEKEQFYYCFEFNRKAVSLDLRLFQREASGAVRFKELLPTTLSAHRSGAKVLILAKDLTLLFPIGDMDEPVPNLVLKKDGGKFGLSVRLATGKEVAQNGDSEAPLTLDNYGYDEANQFADNEYPVRGIADFDDIKIIVNLVPAPSSYFSSDQRSMAKSAIRIYVDRGFSSAIIQCTQKRAGADFPFNEAKDLSKVLVNATMGNPVSDDSMALIPIYVVPSKGYRDAPGLSHANNFNLGTNTFPGATRRRYFYISLNTDYLGIGSLNGTGGDADYWAGVVGRLMLQNLGFQGVSESENNFLLSYQQCVQENGELK